jgi:phenylpyruvate tautomerase PptA (4-oxalocrotonate tautomerase family)
MPLVKVSLLKGKSKEEKKALSDAIHAALMEAFRIPENDRNQRIFEFEPENFDVPEGKTSNYTLIEITAFPGRSLDAKRKLYQTIVKNLNKLDIQPNDLLIVLKEPPLDNWGVRGGIPASEIDLGFKLDVKT